VTWAEVYLRTKWHLDPSSRLATTDIGRKLGVVPPFGGTWIPTPGPRPTTVPSGILIYLTVWPQQTRAENSERTVPLLGEAGSPSNNVAWTEAYLRTKWHPNPFPFDGLGCPHRKGVQQPPPPNIVLDGDLAPPKEAQSTPNFQPMSVVAKRLHGSRCHLVRR